MRIPGSVCIWVSGWYACGHPGYGAIGLGTWGGVSAWLEEWKGCGMRSPMVSPASPQGFKPLGSQYLILSPAKLYRSFLGTFSSARDTLKASGVQLYVPGRWEAET